MSDIDVLVVGGGISGLAIATSLLHRGVSVELWESSLRPGGKIETDGDSRGYLTERAANMVMNFRPEVNRFIEQSNLVAKKAMLAPIGIASNVVSLRPCQPRVSHLPESQSFVVVKRQSRCVTNAVITNVVGMV